MAWSPPMRGRRPPPVQPDTGLAGGVPDTVQRFIEQGFHAQATHVIEVAGFAQQPVQRIDMPQRAARMAVDLCQQRRVGLRLGAAQCQPGQQRGMGLAQVVAEHMQHHVAHGAGIAHAGVRSASRRCNAPAPEQPVRARAQYSAQPGAAQ